MIIEYVWIYDELVDLANECLYKIEIAKKNGSISMQEFYEKKYLATTELISFIIIEETDDLFKENRND